MVVAAHNRREATRCFDNFTAKVMLIQTVQVVGSIGLWGKEATILKVYKK